MVRGWARTFLLALGGLAGALILSECFTGDKILAFIAGIGAFLGVIITALIIHIAKTSLTFLEFR